MRWFVYILECCDGSYHVGHSHDVSERLKQYNAKMGAKWTAQRVRVKAVYTEEYSSESQAMEREKQLKGWSKAKKNCVDTCRLLSFKRAEYNTKEARCCS